MTPLTRTLLESIFDRTLTDEVEDMSKVSFAFPPDALQTSPEKSRAAAASPAGRSPEQAAARSPVEAAADPFAASAAAAAAADRSILAGTGLEDLFDPSPTGGRIFHAMPTFCFLGCLWPKSSDFGFADPAHQMLSQNDDLTLPGEFNHATAFLTRQ